jgi:hypothetical protein
VTLYEMGASLDLRFAAGLGLIDEMKGFFKEDGTLTDKAISTHRPLREGETGQWAGYFAGKEIIDLLTETE